MLEPQTLFLFSLLVSYIIVIVVSLSSAKLVQQKISFKILFALMVCQLISQTIPYLKFSGIIFQMPWLYRFSYPFELCSAPLVYLYLQSMTQSQFSIKSVRKIHLLPGLIGLCWYLLGQFYFPMPDQADQGQMAYDRHLLTILSAAIMVPYLWKSRKTLLSFQESAKNYYADLGNLRLPWLKYLLFVCYLALAFKILDIATGPEIPLWAYQGLLTNMGLVGLVYFALKVSELFHSEMTTPPAATEPESIEEANLSEALLNRIRAEGLFLKPQIRLSDLADEMGMKSYKLSEIINRGLKTNFYDLINGMRIEHAKALMQDPKNDHLNLLGVAIDSGFNSKSVFNDSFKRFVGMTPSEFRSHLKDKS